MWMHHCAPIDCNGCSGEAIFSQFGDSGLDGGADGSTEGSTDSLGEVRVQADIVVAADGAASKARSLLQELVWAWPIDG